jgi:ATP-binding cassette, subfamily B, bacterial
MSSAMGTQPFTFAAMKILLQYLRPNKKHVLLALVLAAVNQCFSLLEPYITGRMFDSLITHKEDFMGDWTFYRDTLLKFLLLAMGAAMVSRIAKNFQDYFTSVVIQRSGAAMYTDGIQHSLRLPYEDFEDQRSGETLGKLQKVRIDSEKLIQSAIGIFFQSLVGIVFVVVVAMQLNWRIVPLFLATIPLLAIISNLLSKRIKTISKTILGETTSLAGGTTESLRNIELVKGLGLADQEIERLNKVTKRILALELRKVKFIRSLSFVQGTTVNFLRTCLVFFLYYLVFHGQLSGGEIWTMTIYSFFIFGPLQEMGNVIATYREAQASLQNFEDLMQQPSEPSPLQPQPLSSIEKFKFEGVYFKHKTAQYNALENIHFEVKKGQTVAFVGPSGSGKTTLVKLLIGLYRPHEGSIYYNENRSVDVHLMDFRSQIGFVTQDTQLFAGTIRENLLFVKPHASDAELMDALEKAACSNLMSRAEKGLDTTIGEGGIKISGGEKQRLSIARAMLRKPTILIMDEATSALDSMTEAEITETVKQIHAKQHIMTVLIAHRLSTIMHADQIFVLEHGKIIEQGSHENLLAEKGLYYAMWRQQIGERKR